MIRLFPCQRRSGRQRHDYGGTGERHLFQSAAARPYRNALHEDVLHGVQAGRVCRPDGPTLARHWTKRQALGVER